MKQNYKKLLTDLMIKNMEKGILNKKKRYRLDDIILHIEYKSIEFITERNSCGEYSLMGSAWHDASEMYYVGTIEDDEYELFEEFKYLSDELENDYNDKNKKKYHDKEEELFKVLYERFTNVNIVQSPVKAD